MRQIRAAIAKGGVGFSVQRRSTSRRVNRGESRRVSKGSRASAGDCRERRGGGVGIGPAEASPRFLFNRVTRCGVSHGRPWVTRVTTRWRLD